MAHRTHRLLSLRGSMRQSVGVLAPVDADLAAIVADVIRANRTEPEWAAVESDEMFCLDEPPDRAAGGVRARPRESCEAPAPPGSVPIAAFSGRLGAWRAAR